MTIAQFKKVARLLKLAYAELQKEFIDNNEDILSDEYDVAVSIVREKILEHLGFTLEEYREAKELVAPAKKVDVSAEIEATKAKVESLVIPTDYDIAEMAHRVANEYIKAPVITNNTINQIVKETIVEKPTIVKETVIQREEYDPSPLYAELGYLNDKVSNIKPPKEVDVEAMKEELRSEFMAQFEHNIDTLGMPDFRKLAMGLQAQIDDVKGAASTIAGTFETISRNLSDSDATYYYTGLDLTSIVYANGITKTLNYTGGDLTSIVLSGNTPSNISLTKTLTYSNGDLTTIAYS